jgi:hypothetical protein
MNRSFSIFSSDDARYLQSFVGTNLAFLVAVLALSFGRSVQRRFGPSSGSSGAIGTKDWYMNFRRSNTTRRSIAK